VTRQVRRAMRGRADVSVSVAACKTTALLAEREVVCLTPRAGVSLAEAVRLNRLDKTFNRKRRGKTADRGRARETLKPAAERVIPCIVLLVCVYHSK